MRKFAWLLITYGVCLVLLLSMFDEATLRMYPWAPIILFYVGNVLGYAERVFE